MKHMFPATCLMAALLAPASFAAAEPAPTAATAPAAVTLLQAACEALQQLETALRTISSEASATAALPAVQAAVQAYHKSIAALPDDAATPDTPEYTAGLKRLRTVYRRLRTLGEGDDFVQWVWQNEALTYHLLIASRHLPCILHEQTADYIMRFHSVGQQEPPAAARPELNRLRAEAAERHAAFMAEHAAQYKGGNGADAAGAIELRPLTEPGGKELTEEEQDALSGRLIGDYMRSVYPWAGFGYGAWMACPDGSFYSIQVLFPGLYTNEQGVQKMLKYPIYFRTRGPRPDRP